MMTHRLRNTLIGCLMASITAVALAGGTVDLRLRDGSHWKGHLDDQVSLVYLKNGVETRSTGKLIKATDYYIQIETTVGGEAKAQTIFRDDILKITAASEPAATAGRPGGDAAVAGAATTTPAPGASSGSKPAAADNSPGVFVLPLREMVGLYFRHNEIEAVAEEADKYGPGQIIVLVIDSGGGAVTEMETIHATLTEIKKRHRVVAWIKKAISAACATAIHCDEIYFMTHGTAGAMTAFNGATGEAFKGKELEDWMRRAGDWMETNGRSRYIAEAMIHAPALLSYDKDPETGKVTFYNDLNGEFRLSGPEENLVFSSSTALHCGFSDGTADTEAELAKLLDLPEWREKSTYGREIAEDWFNTVETAQEKVRLLSQRLEYAGTGSGDPVVILGKRIQIFKEFVRWNQRLGETAAFLGLPPKDVLEREIAEMQRQLAAMKRR